MLCSMHINNISPWVLAHWNPYYEIFLAMRVCARVVLTCVLRLEGRKQFFHVLLSLNPKPCLAM